MSRRYAEATPAFLWLLRRRLRPVRLEFPILSLDPGLRQRCVVSDVWGRRVAGGGGGNRGGSGSAPRPPDRRCATPCGSGGWRCRCGGRRRCCMNRHWPARCPPTGSSPADAIRRWSAEGGHPIQDLTAEDDLTPLPGWAPGAKPAQRPFSGLYIPRSASVSGQPPRPTSGPQPGPRRANPPPRPKPAPKSHAHCHGRRRWPASTPESADLVRGAPGVLVEPVACGVMAGPYARHRIRHGIRHTAVLV